MLNRRLIRIRALQALYAYEQSKKANLILGKELIEQHFTPDLNSMEVQDKVKLSGKAKLGVQLFQEKYAIVKSEEDFEAPRDILEQIKIADVSFQNKTKLDFDRILLQMQRDADKIFEVYYMLLSLYVQMSKMAEADKAKDGLSDISKNKIVQALAESGTFETLCLKNNVDWSNETDFIRKLYREVLKPNAKYMEYCEKRNHTGEEDMALLKYLIKNVFIKHDDCVQFFERYHLYWPEDKETLRAMVSHTFQDLADSGELNIAQPNDEWQERKDFMVTLFKKSVTEEQELMDLIMPKLRNWEYERVAETDKILLKMAIIEMMNYSSIPLKVTINEIIEITKTYSTPKSSQFINGILDLLSKELSQNGMIKKSGRGMMDNK